MIKVLIFDFDGTLVDTKLDIARSVNILLKEEKLPPIKEETIFEFIGNGTDILLKKSFMLFGKKLREGLIERYMKIYEEHMLDNTKPFPGILDMLDRLQNKTLYILTNKHERFTKKILSHFNMLTYFKGVVGADTYNIKKPDPSLVYKILKNEKVRKREALIVGDSVVDIKTGKNSGIKTCAVSWGLGKREELLNEKPFFFVEKPGGIVRIVSEMN